MKLVWHLPIKLALQREKYRVVEQQNTANQILMDARLLCGEYALKGPSRSS